MGRSHGTDDWESVLRQGAHGPGARRPMIGTRRVSGDSVISLKQSVHSDLALTWSSNDSIVVRAISTDANSLGV